MSSGPNTITVTERQKIRVRSNNTKSFEGEMSQQHLTRRNSPIKPCRCIMVYATPLIAPFNTF